MTTRMISIFLMTLLATRATPAHATQATQTPPAPLAEIRGGWDAPMPSPLRAAAKAYASAPHDTTTRANAPHDRARALGEPRQDVMRFALEWAYG